MVVKKIKSYLVEHGISQKELADALGMTPATISMILNGKLNLKIDRYCEICEYLGVEPGAFLSEASTEKKQHESDRALLRGSGRRT